MDENSMMKRIVTFCSEFLATFTLLFLGCMGCVVGIAGHPIPHEQISWTFGLAILVSVQCFGHISGSHLNPIVTVASVICGYTPIALAPIYILGQFAGALGGFGALWLVTPSRHLGNQMKTINGTLTKLAGVCSPGVNPDINSLQAVFVEFIASSMLILVCCAVWDRKNSDKHDSVSVRFGLTVAVLAMAAGPYTGANMNPARSFAPALFNGDWADHWVYWVGPLAAGSVTAAFYKFLFQTPPPEEDHAEGLPLN